MSITRRHLLAGAAASIAGLAASGCKTIEQTLTHPSLIDDPFPPLGEHEAALRLLDRISYGPSPGDITRVLSCGREAYINRQLDPAGIVEPDVLSWRLHALEDVLSPDPSLLFDEDDRRLVAARRQDRTLRAVFSRCQLQERLVEFWSDHFNIYAFKGESPQLGVVDERETIRKNALGSFTDMLLASARSAAMLGYLDNTHNRRGVPNENYAREVMELHTLGVDAESALGRTGACLAGDSVVNAFYTQTDVKELARCLTGWTSERHWHRGRFEFDKSLHDTGPKSVLGTDIAAGGGVEDAETVLRVLAIHPATARHLATKLCRYFIGDTSQALVDRATSVYLRTRGSIKPMVAEILKSDEILFGPPIFKRPFDYVVSALRALNADTDGGAGIADHLQKMGQPLFGWPMPNGYPTEAATWMAGCIPRWNFALDLLSSGIDATSVDLNAIVERGRRAGLSAVEAVAEMVYSRPSTSPLVAGVRGRLGDEQLTTRETAALFVMSPEFQGR